MLFAGLAAGAAFLLGYQFGADGHRLGLPAALEPEPAHARANKFPAAMMRELSRVYNTVHDHYVDEVDPDMLFEEAIRGMVGSLDPYSVYFDEDDFKSFEESISGQFGGIGIYVDMKQGVLYVVSPIENTPAQRAGIKAGDIIIELNGEPTRDTRLSDAIDVMRGKPGTSLDMKVARKGSGEHMRVLDFTLKREKIQTPSVSSELAEKDIGYVRISQFQPEQTVADLAKHVNRLVRENGGGLRGLLLDLRYNPGGDLGASIGVASVFLAPGLEVVSARNRDNVLERREAGGVFFAPDDLDDPRNAKEMKMVVLVNGGSASASEIVAGALQDHSRALIVGTKTYGKATVQRVIPLNSGGHRSALKLTTARYYTPSGRSIQSTGIDPDVEIEQEAPPAADQAGEEDAAAGDGTQAEADNSELSMEEITRELEETGQFRKPGALPQDDPQFEQALEILRTMSLVASE